ncbi:MAG TPA: hypothetical protein VJJ82_04980 [Candidatus Nanoarchaeia archaeon]|nr:hypothetical protein [Candidatus Nanoarchaeia archaeon]
MSQLFEYVQKLLSQGYSSSSIRSTLLSAGYSPYEIDMAFSQTSHNRITTLPLVLALVLVLALIAGGIYLFAPGPELPLTFSIDVLTPRVTSGDQATIAAQITNPNPGKISATLQVVVRAPNGTTYPSQKTALVEEQASVPFLISLPADASGKHVVTAKLTWKSQSSTQTAAFEVTRARKTVTFENREQHAIDIQQTCPLGCDDQNFCTTDFCNAGTCESVPVVPCCGNRNCEAQESEATCLIDCTKRITSTDIREEALKLARTNLQQSITTCGTLAQQSYVDECLATVSDQSSNKLPCEQIVSDDLRDACYIPFSYNNDFTVCEKITNQAIKNSCFVLASVQGTQGG